MQKIILSLFFFLFSTLFSSESSTFHYEKKIGTSIESITVVVTKDADKIVIAKQEDEGITQMEYDPNYLLQKYSFTAKNPSIASFSLERKDKTLFSETKKASSSQTQNFPLSNGVWIQDFSTGLIPFLQTDREEMGFWIFDVTRQKWFELVARRQERHPLTVDGKKYEVQKIRISPDGLGSMFWKAELWFDKTTNTLVMEMSNEGPNTPSYMLQLTSEIEKVPSSSENSLEKPK